MAKQVNDLALNPGDPWYYTPGWLACVEDHLEILRNAPDTKPIAVTDTDRYRYQSDFNGYLRDQTVFTQPQYAYVIMRMNYMFSPLDFDDTVVALAIPNQGTIDYIMAKYKTSRMGS